MRNKYPAQCYVCKKLVKKGEGYFERNGRGGWQVRHIDCESQHYLKFKKRDKNMKNKIETEYTNNPTCPYCGCEIEDWRGIDICDDTEDETTCGECGKEFIFVPHIGEWTFNSFKK